MFYLFHLKSKFSVSLSRSHYQSIKNLMVTYIVIMVIKIKLKVSIVYLCRHLLVQSQHRNRTQSQQ